MVTPCVGFIQTGIPETDTEACVVTGTTFKTEIVPLTPTKPETETVPDACIGPETDTVPETGIGRVTSTSPKTVPSDPMTSLTRWYRSPPTRSAATVVPDPGL
jgi:hypothetical protein